MTDQLTTSNPSLSPPDLATAPVSPGTPTRDELAVLSLTERIAFRIARRMNSGYPKRFWTTYQRVFPVRLIQFVIANLLRVHGLEHFHAASGDRPVLLVSNHRSCFVLYVIGSMLVQRTDRPLKTFFPVRGRFFYESPIALAINAIAGWSMYPPLFHAPEKRLFNTYALRVLADLCRHGEGHVLGFHPEGTRNRGSDPYSFLRPQPGIGKLIMDTSPQVIPVFIAGLGNSALRQVRANWSGGELIRIHFGPQLDLSSYLAKDRRARTYLEIAEFLMARIAELGEQDRALYAAPLVRG